MGKDRFIDRFRKRQDKKQLGERARGSIPQDQLDAEEEILANTKPVDPIEADKEPGRNDPCPCGSGKKYKKCCGAKK